MKIEIKNDKKFISIIPTCGDISDVNFDSLDEFIDTITTKITIGDNIYDTLRVDHGNGIEVFLIPKIDDKSNIGISYNGIILFTSNYVFDEFIEVFFSEKERRIIRDHICNFYIMDCTNQYFSYHMIASKYTDKDYFISCLMSNNIGSRKVGTLSSYESKFGVSYSLNMDETHERLLYLITYAVLSFISYKHIIAIQDLMLESYQEFFDE